VGIAYRVNEPDGVSVSVWTGEVTSDQAMQHVAELAASPDWGTRGRILTDLTGLVFSALPDRDQVSELADAFTKQLDGRAQPSRWAIVANVAFPRASQFSEAIVGEVRSLIVFFDLASACIWLDIELDALRPVLESLRVEARSQDAGPAD
jgi:hypothetical protein